MVYLLENIFFFRIKLVKKDGRRQRSRRLGAFASDAINEVNLIDQLDHDFVPKIHDIY